MRLAQARFYSAQAHLSTADEMSRGAYRKPSIFWEVVRSDSLIYSTFWPGFFPHSDLVGPHLHVSGFMADTAPLTPDSPDPLACRCVLSFQELPLLALRAAWIRSREPQAPSTPSHQDWAHDAFSSFLLYAIFLSLTYSSLLFLPVSLMFEDVNSVNGGLCIFGKIHLPSHSTYIKMLDIV